MKKIISETGLYLLAALLFTLFLGYVDEGYYNFQFLTSIGNVLVLSIYMVVLWVCEIAVSNMLKHTNLASSNRIIISILTGLFLPITIILWVAG